MAHDVFISYAVEDKEAADKVCRALEGQGIKCWIAPRDVPFGADYEEAIVDGIAASRLLVLILSPHSNASPHVKREIQNACVEGSGTEIIPFRIGEVPYNKALRYYLGSAQWLDASTPPLEQHLQPLVQHVRERIRLPHGKLPPYPTEVMPLADMPGERPEPEPVPVVEPKRRAPVVWLALGAGALLLVIITAVVATRSRGGGNVTNPPSNLATPAVNSNVNQQGNGNAQQRTPTPTPTPAPTRSPIRVFPTNVNIRRPVNRNR